MAVRPIAVGETLRRVVGKFVMGSQQVTAALAYLHPQQLGVKVEGACETIPMAIQNWILAHAKDPSWAALQVDVENAFNSIDRAAISEEVGSTAPELQNWVNLCYAAHSLLFIDGEPITSEQGVQQGDPLGPLLYSLAWQRVVRKLPPELAINLWYLDDGHLIGPPDILRKALDIIKNEGQLMGIRLNSAKCCLWGPMAGNQDPKGTHVWDRIPRTPWTPDSGIKVLGIPVVFPHTFGFAK